MVDRQNLSSRTDRGGRSQDRPLHHRFLDLKIDRSANSFLDLKIDRSTTV